MRLTQTLLLYLFFTLPLHSQTYLPIEHITTKDGLSYREVNDILQDSTGFLWLATTRGLNRYDGVEWITFNHLENDSTTLPEDRVNWICDAGKGNLLVGMSYRISLFDPAKNEFRPVRLFAKPNSFTSLDNSLQVLEQGNTSIEYSFDLLWITPYHPVTHPTGDILLLANITGKKGQYLIRYSGNERLEILGKAQPQPVEEAILSLPDERDPKQVYWNRLTPKLYLRWQVKDASWQIYDFDLPAVRKAHAKLPIDRQRRFWFPSIRSREGPIFQSFILPAHIPLSDWSSFTFDNHHNIWLKEVHGRIFKYDVQRKSLRETGEFDITRFGLEKELFEDQEGTLWMPHRFGLTKVKKRHQYFENYLNDPEQLEGISNTGHEVYPIAEDHFGRIYISAERIFWLDPKTKEITEAHAKVAHSTQPVPIYSIDLGGLQILTAGDSIMWFTSGMRFSGQLHKYDPQKNTLVRYPFPDAFPYPFEYSLSMEEDSQGRIWIGQGQLAFFDPKKETFELDTLRHYPFLNRALKRDGHVMWAGAKGGLVKFNDQHDKLEFIRIFPGKTEFLQNTIFAILPYEGYVWLATTEGLIRFDPVTQQSKFYTEADGLPHNLIYTLLADGHYLWMGTHQGLCKFNIHSGAVKNYYVEDGLSHNEFNKVSALKSRSGKMYFGGMNGVNAFYPSVLDSLEQTKAPTLVWTGFSKLDGKSDSLVIYPRHKLSTLLPLRLHHRDKTLTFSYALLSFSDPLENDYYYFLEGLEKNWNAAGLVAEVTYHSIPPGSYTLLVKATAPGGNAGANELRIPIIMYPAWWQTRWAFAGFGVAIVGLFLIIRQYERKRAFIQLEARRLQELDLVKSRLYTNITHEFRTPLTIILGMAEQVLHHPEDWFRDGLQMIQRNGQNLLRLVNQMLDLSRLESGALPIHLIQGDSIAFLRYLTQSFQSLAKTRQIQLSFHTDPEALQMDYDPDKLQQILSNLLSNALKFTPPGGSVELVVSSQRLIVSNEMGKQQSAVESLCLKIKDTGIGIPEEQLPYIFDRFYRVGDVDTRQTEPAQLEEDGGTGIGLALTKELVKLLQGEIRVESSPGQGSCFIVQLPITNEAPLSGKTPAATVAEGVSALVTAWPQKVILRADEIENQTQAPLLLIIEDNTDVVRYLSTLLKSRYRLQVAENGRKGIERAIALVPDIIISDVMMPEKDGFEVCSTLKQDERTSHIPIILLTAKADMSSRIDGLKWGADAYLAKPFHKEELFVRLQQLIELRKRLQARFGRIDLAVSPKESEVLPEIADHQVESLFLQKIRKILEEHLSNDTFGVTELSEALGISRVQLHRKLKALTGQSASHYLRAIRLHKGKALLEQTDLNVSQVAFEVGFKHPTYFARLFLEEFGVNPRAVR